MDLEGSFGHDCGNMEEDNIKVEMAISVPKHIFVTNSPWHLWPEKKGAKNVTTLLCVFGNELSNHRIPYVPHHRRRPKFGQSICQHS